MNLLPTVIGRDFFYTNYGMEPYPCAITEH